MEKKNVLLGNWESQWSLQALAERGAVTNCWGL